MSEAQVNELKNFIDFKFKNAQDKKLENSKETICLCKKKINKSNLSRHLLIKHYFCNFCQEFHVPAQFKNCPVYNEVLNIIYD